jgi:hypothetical protein
LSDLQKGASSSNQIWTSKRARITQLLTTTSSYVKVSSDSEKGNGIEILLGDTDVVPAHKIVTGYPGMFLAGRVGKEIILDRRYFSAPDTGTSGGVCGHPAFLLITETLWGMLINTTSMAMKGKKNARYILDVDNRCMYIQTTRDLTGPRTELLCYYNLASPGEEDFLQNWMAHNTLPLLDIEKTIQLPEESRSVLPFIWLYCQVPFCHWESVLTTLTSVGVSAGEHLSYGRAPSRDRSKVEAGIHCNICSKARSHCTNIKDDPDASLLQVFPLVHTTRASNTWLQGLCARARSWEKRHKDQAMASVGVQQYIEFQKTDTTTRED